jgi:hypothetical protein
MEAMREYDLAYYYTQSLKDGGRVRLEFYRVRGSIVFRTIPIGDVLNGLSLEIQGQSDDIDTPIVKTALHISLVDAPEMNTISLKAGNWEEFYTPDSEGWKVVLLGARKDEAELRTLWSGYLTPDSFSETLSHHGVVTVVARDNIGHLSDMEFDGVGNASGMITPYELISQAWEKIASPMRLDWRGYEDENEFLQTEGVDAVDTYLNVEAFEGMTWYDAVSDVLYAYGLTMRYTGDNRVSICPLRRLPMQGKDYDVIVRSQPTFAAYATRELTPAVKDIEDVMEYDLPGDVAQANPRKDEFSGETGSCPFTKKDEYGAMETGSAVVNPLSNEGDYGWGNIQSNTLFLDASLFRSELRDSKANDTQVFLAACTKNRMVWYGKQMRLEDDLMLTIERGTMAGKLGNILVDVGTQKQVSLLGAIKRVYDGKEEYYNGVNWQQTTAELTMVFNEDGVYELLVPSHGAKGYGLLQVFITGVEVEWLFGYPENAVGGVYIGIKTLSYGLSSTRSLMSKNAVKTVYDENNNVQLTRSPKFGPAYDEVALTDFIMNGIFRKDGDNYVPTPEWKWKGEDKPLQLAAQVHRQLLMFHSKPNNLIEGDIMNADLTNVPTIWSWRGKEHMMTTGKYNFCNNRIEGAQLREFIRYEEMW